MLATCPVDTLRDGPRAVKLATQSCEHFEWKEPRTLDTLAAANAEAGDYRAAIKWQTQAIKLATDDNEYQTGAEKRLALYKQHKPYRERRRQNSDANVQHRFAAFVNPTGRSGVSNRILRLNVGMPQAPPTRRRWFQFRMKTRESGMPDEGTWDSYFDPEAVLDRLQIRSGDVVEFGCGFGTFTLPAAKRTTRIVYALDIDPGMVALVRSKAAAAKLENIRSILRDFMVEGTGLPDASAATRWFQYPALRRAREPLARACVCVPVGCSALCTGGTTRRRRAAPAWRFGPARSSA